jgi:hypothetical protein
MTADTRPRQDTPETPPRADRPRIAACGSGPETTVFVERGNTDGWIASDVTVDVTR